MFLINFIFIVSQLKTPSCSVKYFKSSDVIVIKKKIINILLAPSLFYALSRVKKYKMVAQSLDLRIDLTRILI